jgi:clan AA aspartic protease
MGTFQIPIYISPLEGGQRERLDALVDTGATYTMVPRDILARLGVTPEEKWPFILADGREMYYDVGWIGLEISGRRTRTIVIFGDPGSEALLGAFALEGLRLAADPVNERLISVPGLLKSLLPQAA